VECCSVLVCGRVWPKFNRALPLQDDAETLPFRIPYSEYDLRNTGIPDAMLSRTISLAIWAEAGIAPEASRLPAHLQECEHGRRWSDASRLPFTEV
jgi:hypothetical protein